MKYVVSALKVTVEICFGHGRITFKLLPFKLQSVGFIFKFHTKIFNAFLWAFMGLRNYKTGTFCGNS